MRFSVIIPTYKRTDLLKKCLDSIYSQDYPIKRYEVIVVDDGSDEKTRKICMRFKRQYGNLKYYQSVHLGPGAARNLGMEKAKNQFFAFTDDDCVVDKNWLRGFESAFMSSDADVIGGGIINPTKRYIAWAQYILNFSSWFAQGKKRLVSDVPPANACYRRTAVEKKRFPDYPATMGYEDTMFNFSLIKEGKKILFSPDVKVWHFTWLEDYGLKKFFKIQKKAAVGFASGGYRAHGAAGKVLMKIRVLNLLCPRLFFVFYRSVRYGYFSLFLLCSPLIFAGELYRGWIILRN